MATGFSDSCLPLPVYSILAVLVWLFLAADQAETLIFVAVFVIVTSYCCGGARAITHWVVPQRMIVARRKLATKIPQDVSPYTGEPSKVPSLNVVIMITGTHGDVAPFVALGHELKRRYRHRIRIATHATHRDYVMQQGLDFYPLAGDPRVMSSWMVQSQGRLLPKVTSIAGLMEDTALLPQKAAMIGAIMESTWPACTDQLPEEMGSKVPRFVAHAIISNPVTYGHIHCASALNIPIHMAFPQPWTPTHEYPHPLTQEFGKMPNHLTYYAFDTLNWMSLPVNEWRSETLKLPQLLIGDRGPFMLNDLEVPFAYMWSPTLCPKAKDWGAHVDVVGTLLHDTVSSVEYTPDPALAAFLDHPDKPAFIGFGSMVIADPQALYTIIVKAAKQTGTRMIVQSSWSKFGDTSEVPEGIYLVGNCPHSWLFQHCSAVIHHGGAGTVAAGLRFSLPTLVCPFFGDQHFWGEIVRRAGVGPPPCPIQDLTVERLAESLEVLRSSETRTRAEEMATAMMQEDGVGKMCDVFTQHLPVHDMVCLVSLFAKSEPRVVVAETWHSWVGLRVSAEVHACLQESGCWTQYFQDYGYVIWDTQVPVFFGHSVVLIPGYFTHFTNEVVLTLVSPFKEVLRVLTDWRETGGREGPFNVASAVFLIFFITCFDIPTGLLTNIWNFLRSMYVILSRCFGGLSLTLISTPVPHPGIRPKVKVADIPLDRRQDLVHAAVIAEHVISCVTMAQRRSFGDVAPTLAPDELSRVLCFLALCPPPQARECNQTRYSRYKWIGRRVARVRSWWSWCVPEADLEIWPLAAGMPTIDFCLKYAQRHCGVPD